MNTLTIKVPPNLEQDLMQLSEQTRLSKSELVRRALAAFVTQHKSAAPFVSALDRAGDAVGCFSGSPPDLASNPTYMNDFGRV